MKREDIPTLVPIFKALGDERDRRFRAAELPQLSEGTVPALFQENPGLWVPSEDVCGNAACGWADIVAGQWAQCTKHPDATKLIREPERYRRWSFVLGAFFHGLQEILGTTSDPQLRVETMTDLGARTINGRSWRFFYNSTRSITDSPLLLAGLRAHYREDALIVFTEIEGVSLGLLEGLNVFTVPVSELAGESIDQLVKRWARQRHHTLDSWQVIRDQVQGTMNPYLVSPLVNQSGSALSQSFEDQAFATMAPFFHTPIQLGKEYAGKSLPDGILFGKVDKTSYYVFEDCKSFMTAEFNPKADDAQQQVYYSELLSRFAERTSLLPAGCLIVTTLVPEAVANKLGMLQPWQILAQKAPLIVLPADVVEHIGHVKALISPHTYDDFDRSVLFRAIFLREILPENADLDKELLDEFERQRSRSSYLRIHTLTRMEMEVFLIVSYLRGRNREVHAQVDKMVVNASPSGHRVLGTNWSPAERQLIRYVEQGQFEEALDRLRLHPFSLLLLTKSFQDLHRRETSREFEEHFLAFRTFLRERCC